jgi:hypothetical protein
MGDETYDLMPGPQGDPGTIGPPALSDEPPMLIDHDLPCRHCGYNLRGLTTDRACPECGTAVGRTLLGDQLRFSDPAWVRTLAKGMTWLLYGVLAQLLVALSTPFAGLFYQSINTHALQLASAFAGMLSLVGYWLITTPEPTVEAVSGMTVRSLVRWTKSGALLAGLTNLVMLPAVRNLGMAIGLVASILGIVGFFALFVYARRLALRVPDYPLASQTRVVMWGIVTTLGLMVLFGVLIVGVGVAGIGPGAVFVFALPVCMAGVAYLVFVIWSLVLVFWYRRVAVSAARDAEITWGPRG